MRCWSKTNRNCLAKKKRTIAESRQMHSIELNDIGKLSHCSIGGDIPPVPRIINEFSLNRDSRIKFLINPYSLLCSFPPLSSLPHRYSQRCFFIISACIWDVSKNMASGEDQPARRLGLIILNRTLLLFCNWLGYFSFNIFRYSCFFFRRKRLRLFLRQ